MAYSCGGAPATPLNLCIFYCCNFFHVGEWKHKTDKNLKKQYILYTSRNACLKNSSCRGKTSLTKSKI